MALSPREIENRRKSELQKEIEAAEARIDSQLVIGNRTFSYSVIGHKIVDDIKRKYEYVGWKVTVVHDMRDGAYLKFEEK